jgi:hypothetical protein
MRLAPEIPKPPANRKRVLSEPMDEITFIIGDWAVNLRELFNKE